MSKPVVNRINPFDGSKDYTVSMSYLGNMPYSNRVIVYDAITLSVVYDSTTTNTKFSIDHTIPSNTLVNGKKYAVQGQVFDSTGKASLMSDKVYFWCLATPDFYFNNISDGTIFNTASIYAELIYNQSDWEDISEYRFYLYNETKGLLLESEMFYTTDNMTYAYRGLDDDNFYYIRAKGTTVNGIQMDTGYIKIFVNYENPKDYKLIFAECNERNSVVTYQTNFVVINPSDTTTEYQYENGWINLVGKTLVYDKDFIVTGDFTMTIRGRELYKNTTILRCSNSQRGFTLSSYIYDDGQMRYKLLVPNGLCNYVLYTDPITPEDIDIVTIHIRRINNRYELFCFVETGYQDLHNMWFGLSQPPLNKVDKYDIWINTDNTNTVRVDKNDVNIFYQADEPILLVENDYDIWIK